MWRFPCACSRGLAFASPSALGAQAAEGPPTEPKAKALQTQSGVRFAVLGDKPPAPAPTLFIFATSADESLAAVEGE